MATDMDTATVLVSTTAPAREPAHVRTSGNVFATAGWLGAWERAPADDVLDSRYVTALAADGSEALAPVYHVADSSFWRGYEQDAGVPPVWGGPVAYLPSLHSFRGPFDRSSVAAAALTVDAARACVEDWEAQALVVANLAPDVAGALAAARPPDVLIRLDTAFAAELPPTLDAYFAALKRDHRADLRRRRRRATERGVVFAELEGDAILERIEEFFALAVASEVKHGIEPTYDLATFRALVGVPGARLLVAERAGEMLAGFYAFPCGDCLTLWSGGILYSALREFSPYVFLLHEVLLLAYARGFRRLDFGRGNGGFKERHGCAPTDLWTLAYLGRRGGPRLADRLRTLHHRLR
ncbi:MAG TPA: GNAT family N-acetyltransferase [Solirubrobacteraceae bacterium]|jgi:hypothetical protein